MPVISALRQWRNGEVFNARDYVYERNLIVAELNRLTSIFSGLGNTTNARFNDVTVNRLYAEELILDGGTLNQYLNGATVYTGPEPTTQLPGDIWFHEYE